MQRNKYIIPSWIGNGNYSCFEVLFSYHFLSRRQKSYLLFKNTIFLLQNFYVYLHIYIYIYLTQMLKKMPIVQETWIWALGWEDPLEKGMATHFSILLWRIPWIEEPDGLYSMWSQRVRHYWATNTFIVYLTSLKRPICIKKFLEINVQLCFQQPKCIQPL